PVEPVSKDGRGVAVKGYDVVAYFTQSKPVKGSSQFTHQWMGATWQFASAEDRDLFKADPEKYAPQFGGYCAWAVSKGYTAETDPDAWKIIGGKLYLNYSKSIQKQWEQDVLSRIDAANKNWPTLHK
ncbi:MAG: YHS domain-containing (seleno)protein, partial [Bryobacteraceae bacterium]